MDELKHMGVTVELKCGVKFVAATLRFPLDPSCITPESVLSLLGCIRILLQESQHALPEDFMKRISRNWLKSHAGYRSPQKCLLFDCNVHLKQTDGPFIDEEFFGSNITSYREELKAIGVTVDVQNGCSLIASHLELHSEYSTIVRIYNYLSKCGWKPDSEAGKRIWIPNGNENGEWVKPEACVLHDKDDLFSLKLNVLEKHYDKKLLPFFSYALDAKSNPSIDDYCELWREWETCVKKLSDAECCKFWGFIVQHWNLKTEKKLAQSLMKLPAGSGSEGVFLVDKHDVFIADDLQLKHLFQQFSHHPIFVWYPQLSLPSLSRSDLVEIYRKIGVRSISESVQKDELSVLDGVEFTQVDGRKVFIGKELVKLILGFLAGPTIKMEARKRHEAVQGLLNLTVYETVEPVSVSYQLSLSTGEIINKKANRMMRWERGSSEFFTQKMEWSSGHKNIIQYATYYSEAISVGVLCDEIDHVCALSELIKLAFVLKFDEEALAFLMATKNLQIFQEDKDFLNAAFLSE
ncbi:ATP/DNA-binding protein [Quillaja saponaria]|uniref:ATP/DNA-binding protein n=1 Tax=Quillaja saponaria TaxID=32244 RepID=A0AAD7P8H0_QUISA|nr:ATP/DNA-binding protein [Quillaja saponaria]